jgi:5-methylcytosine-specific restriction endonuclease McrA
MKYIKLFEELTKVMTYKSQSGNTRTYASVHDDENPNIKSAAAGIMLNDYYAGIENADVIRLKEAGIPVFSIKNSPKKIQKLVVTLNNLEFLIHTLKEDGILYCEYCNEGPLKIYNKFTNKDYGLENNQYYINDSPFNDTDGATCDHKEPQSKGGDKLDYKNLAVCCHSCNQKKGSISYEDWMNKIAKKSIVESLITKFRFFKK